MANNNDKKVLNVPALRFPEFTEEWQGEQLHEIAELSKGIGISKEQLSELHVFFTVSYTRSINQRLSAK